MSQRLVVALAAAAALFSLTVAPASAAGDQKKPERQSWSFAGPFGYFDRAQLQRGFKVYREVCASCHSATLLAFRNLAEPGGPGFTEAQAKAIAAEYKVQDGPNDSGEMFERPAGLADRLPAPFPNDKAARAANGGAMPPDFSVIAKARTYERGFPWFILDVFTQYQEQGVDYIYALLNGYTDAPNGEERPGLHHNEYFPGGWIAMPKPINDGQVEYTDGTPTTVRQYSKDVTAFLMWVAEPHLEARKRIGFQVMIFLIVFATLLYFTKKKVWQALDGHA